MWLAVVRSRGPLRRGWRHRGSRDKYVGSMARSDYDVFISHTQQDRATAEAICRELENSGMRCWIAPRDISEGDDWTASIMHGINQCRVMVIVFSGHTNRSAHVHREVNHAFKRGLIVIPFRVDEIEASERFE